MTGKRLCLCKNELKAHQRKYCSRTCRDRFYRPALKFGIPRTETVPVKPGLKAYLYGRTTMKDNNGYRWKK